jgi:hypothetical protein
MRIGKDLRATVAAVALVACAPAAAMAQPTDRFFAGAGLAIGVNDLVERASQNFPGIANTLSHAWIVDGGGWLTPRIAISGELFKPPEITAGVSRAVQTIEETEQETALTATVRLRAFARQLLAIDLLGGGGVLVLNRQLVGEVTFPQQHQAFNTSERRTSTAFVGGVDMTLHAVGRLDVAPILRVYRFNRDVPGSLVDHSSNRFLVGIVARAAW